MPLSKIKRVYRSVAERLFQSPSPVAAHDSPLSKYVDLNALLPSSELLRLGTSYGGWNIPGKADLSGDSTVYCAGAGEDISFDCSLAERFHCWVRIIDPTPRALQHFKNLEKAVMSGQRLPINNNPDECYTIGPEDFGRLKFLPVGIADRDA